MHSHRSFRSRAVTAAIVFAGFATAATGLGVSASAQSAPTRAERAPAPSRAERLLIRSGDRVSVSVSIGGVQAYGSGIASGSGGLGDTIRVLPSEGRRALTARITGPGTVEVKP